MADELVIVVTAIGIPASVFRLWWIWWKSVCGQCGFEHSACVCPAGDHMMRRRK
jgi:hypothetical protein